MSLNLNIRQRTLALFINILIAYVIFVFFSEQYSILRGLEAVWFSSAISFWFLTLLAAPWFPRPRNVIVSALGAFLLLITVSIPTSIEFSEQLNIIRLTMIGLCLFLLVIATLAIFFGDPVKGSPIGKFFFRLSSNFGVGEVLFSGPAIISIIGANQGSLVKMAWLLLVWIMIIVVRPVEKTLQIFGQFSNDVKNNDLENSVGEIGRIDHPNIVRVKLSPNKFWPAGRLFMSTLSDGQHKYIVSLFSQTQGGEVVATGLCVANVAEDVKLPVGAVISCHDEEKTKEFLAAISGADGSELVGFLVEKSNIGKIRFEIALSSSLKEGDVVFVRVKGQDIFYQIVSAEIVEENFDQNPRGTHHVSATQLGYYSPEKGFKKFAWLPQMNTPVFSAGSRKFDKAVLTDRDFTIGRVPSTNIEAIINVDDLVEYHSAILGVTGTGKTEVALDTIRQAASRGIKVFCVDFTGDYQSRLRDMKPVFPKADENALGDLDAKLFAVQTGTYGAPNEKKALDAFLKTTAAKVEADINAFLTGADEVAILELAEIANTDATLRMTELYLSAIMKWAKNNRNTQKVLIVLEEAHTIIPEVRGAGFSFETQFVVNRIGQIALQGRKYGVGLMVISQRTALVSKTILSQCNTFFTHSLIDQTSLNFLQSVYSAEHAALIPNLEQFEFLAYGKALRAERPIVLRREFDQSILDASKSIKVGPKKAVAPDLAAGKNTPESDGPRITQL